MKKYIFLVIATVTAAAVFSGVCSLPARAALKAGAGRAEITPKPGVFLGGYYYLTERSKGVHDPLNSRALVIDDGTTRIAIINADLVIMGGVFAREIKEKINKETGIAVENINISAQHTHTGPEEYFEEFGRYPKEYVPAIKIAMEDKIVGEVKEAVSKLAPATVGYESFQLDDFNHNRHDPNGPCDKTAVLLVVKDMSGKPIAGFLNFAAHPTVVPAGDLLISGEWTGMFQTMMEEKMGAGSVFLYLQGATGDVGPGTHGVGDGWAQAKDMAERLTAAIFPKLADVKTSPDGTVAAEREEYEFKIRTKKSVSEYNAALPGRIKEIQDSKLSDDEKDRRVGWLRERYGIESFMQMLFPTMNRIKKGMTNSMIEGMRIGDLLLLAFPGEAITEYSIAIRQELSPVTVAVLGYSNDHLGYLTNEKVFNEGGYEAGMGLVYPDSVEQMHQGLLDIARDLEAGKK